MIAIVGCGNLLRGDDGVGPILIRKLWEIGLPSFVKLADGGTAGMDVLFQIKGAKHVIIIDACKTGAEPGTIYEVPGEEFENIPLPQQLNLHAFRWDHAISVGRWLLKDEFPEKITVYLVEAQNIDYGMELSEPVKEAMEQLIEIIKQKYFQKEIEVES